MRRDSTSSSPRASSCAHGPHDLSLELLAVLGKGAQQVHAGAQLDDVAGLGAVTATSAVGTLGVDIRPPARARPRARRAGRGVRPRAAAAAPSGWLASDVVAFECDVDSIARHEPVGRVLAARDTDEAGRLAVDGVLAADPSGVATGRTDQRPEPGKGTHGILAPQVDIEHLVDVVEDVVDLVERSGRAVGRAVVGFVGGTHQPHAGVGDDEDARGRARAGSCRS